MRRTLAALLLAIALTSDIATAQRFVTPGAVVADEAALATLTCSRVSRDRLAYVTTTGQWYHCDGTVYRATTGYGAIPTASATAGVTKTEQGAGGFHRTVYTLTAVSVTMTDAGAAGSHGAIQLLDYPEGLITILGASSDLAVTEAAAGIADTAAVVCGLGSVTVGTDNATLVGAGEATTMPSTAATLTSSAGACDGQMTTALLAIEDGTGTARDLFLNFAIPDADSSATGDLVVAGTVTVTWLGNGDN